MVLVGIPGVPCGDSWEKIDVHLYICFTSKDVAKYVRCFLSYSLTQLSCFVAQVHFQGLNSVSTKLIQMSSLDAFFCDG